MIAGGSAAPRRAGRVRPLVDAQRFRLEDAADAHRRVASGEAAGKVVVEVAGGQ